MRVSRLLAILGLIMLGVISRLLPHPPNFTSISSIALFSAFYLRNCWLSFAIVFSTLFLSDYILVFHATLPFVYLSFGLIILMGYKLKSEIRLFYIAMVCVATSLLFFFITNFGVWMTDFLYPKTLQGLEMCYVAAIPFLMNQIGGDLTYSLLLFGCFALWKNFFQAKNLCPHY